MRSDMKRFSMMLGCVLYAVLLHSVRVISAEDSATAAVVDTGGQSATVENLEAVYEPTGNWLSKKPEVANLSLCFTLKLTAGHVTTTEEIVVNFGRVKRIAFQKIPPLGHSVTVDLTDGSGLAIERQFQTAMPTPDVWSSGLLMVQSVAGTAAYGLGAARRTTSPTSCMGFADAPRPKEAMAHTLSALTQRAERFGTSRCVTSHSRAERPSGPIGRRRTTRCT